MQCTLGLVATSAKLLFKALSHFETLSHDPIRCYRKPVGRTNEIKGCAISLVP